MRLVEAGNASKMNESLASCVIGMLADGKTQDDIELKLNEILHIMPHDPGARSFTNWLFEQIHIIHIQETMIPQPAPMSHPVAVPHPNGIPPYGTYHSADMHSRQHPDILPHPMGPPPFAQKTQPGQNDAHEAAARVTPWIRMMIQSHEWVSSPPEILHISDTVTERLIAGHTQEQISSCLAGFPFLNQATMTVQQFAEKLFQQLSFNDFYKRRMAQGPGNAVPV